MLPGATPEMRARVLRNLAEGKELYDARVKRHMEGIWYLEYFRWSGGSSEDNTSHRVALEAKTREEAELEVVEKWERIKKGNGTTMYSPTVYRPTLCFEKYLETPEHPTETHFKRD